jgi:hypothetical protein
MQGHVIISFSFCFGLFKGRLLLGSGWSYFGAVVPAFGLRVILFVVV